MTVAATNALAPSAWIETLSGAPVLDRGVADIVPVHVRRWTGIAPEIDQAALNQHYLSIHLGGPKCLHRTGEGVSMARDVPAGAHSIVPAGAAFRWNTVGPVDFAHIYVAPRVLDQLIADAFDRDPAGVALQEGLGRDDPLIASLAAALLAELESGDLHRAYVDDLVHLIFCQVLRLHSDARAAPMRARHALAPFRLRRALDFIEASLAEPIGVNEIAAASGLSPFHFSRGFRHATGKPPYAYLLDRRVSRAKLQLRGGVGTLTAIAAQCGFTSLSQFSRMFRQEAGVSPSAYRRRS